jgi:uncharacterized protein (DUF488 family)
LQNVRPDRSQPNRLEFHLFDEEKSLLAALYTIGHSTRTQEELIAVLQAHKIETLVDIRSFPISRRLPHFNRESLEQALPKAGIRYAWMKSLGGFRKKLRDDSPNVALRSVPFRNYADHMLTAEFEEASAELVRLAESSRTAYMCAERVWFHCHRMLLSDWLVAHGHTVLHIDGASAPRPHRLTPEAHLIDNKLIYGEQSLFR